MYLAPLRSIFDDLSESSLLGMNNGCSVKVTTMKPYCRILVNCKNSSIFSMSTNLVTINNSSTIPYRFDHCRNRNVCSVPKNVGYRFKHDSNRKDFWGSDLNCGRNSRLDW